MDFKRYQHVCRFGDDTVRGIDIGVCYIFPKIDGTNSSVWLDDDGNICAGSRNRKLSLDNDNQGFCAMALKDPRIADYLHKHPNHRLYGEWLVPHSLKTYTDDAWRKFYVFDVCVDADNEDGVEYIPYDVYAPWLQECSLDYISPLKIIHNPTFEDLIHCTEINDYLIQDGKGVGEGIVVKNYEYKNQYNHIIWGKIVTSEFKDKHRKEMGAPVQKNDVLEAQIASKYITEAFVKKEFEKVAENGWESRKIPEFLGRVWHEFITEEAWNFIKENKNPTINFKTLHAMVVHEVKVVMPNIF